MPQWDRVRGKGRRGEEERRGNKHATEKATGTASSGQKNAANLLGKFTADKNCTYIYIYIYI
jgi:uncharacterized protein YjcR